MKKKHILEGLLLIPTAAVSAAVARTVLTPTKKSSYIPNPPEDRSQDYTRKLSEMVRCDTTSYANVHELEKFLAFHQTLEQLFPLKRKLTVTCCFAGLVGTVTVPSS